MGKTLYLECCSGISGDMTVAALLDLGADCEKLRKVLDSLPVQGFQIKISNVKKSGLRACDFHVILEEDNHDHDMEYLHGGLNEHEHEPQPHNHADHHIHRGLTEILAIIGQTEMTEHAKEIAVRIFEILAEAEAKAHGLPIEQVHFHEVGAVDSIVDIISVAVCLDDLEVDQVIVTEVYEGQGMIRCQHGIIPVPVPAVTNIAEKYRIRFHMTGISGELVTPTGAAIIAAVRTSDRLPEKFFIQKAGLGAGKRQYELAGILRAMLIKVGD